MSKRPDIFARCESCGWKLLEPTVREIVDLANSEGENMTIEEPTRRQANNHARVCNEGGNIRIKEDLLYQEL